MKALKISLRKLAALEYECYKNALHLHFDSVHLARARSYASAFAISVIASEEFGKGFGIAEISFQAGFTKRLEEHHQKVLMALLSNHKLKQGWFVSKLYRDIGPKGILKHRTILKRYQTIQVAKNNALYVGVRNGNHQIVRPFLISAAKAKQQIRTVNNALIDSVEGTLNGTYCYEEVADQTFRSRRLLNRLKLAAKSLR